MNSLKNMFQFDLQLFAGGEENAGDSNAQPDAQTQTGQVEENTQQTNTGGIADKGGQTLLDETKSDTAEYDFKDIVPEGMEFDQAQADAFASIAKELNLTSEQANKLAAYGMNYAGGMTRLAQEARQQEIANWGNEARKELGIDFDATLQKAGAGLEAMEKAIPNLRQALNYTGAGNRIEMIRMLAFVGDLTKEDTFKGFGANSGAVRSSIYGNTNFGLY